MAVLVESERSRVRWRAAMRERMHGDHGPAILVEAERSRVRGRAAMCERMHGDHGPLCAWMKAHVDVGDNQELNYGDGDHSKMKVDGDHESMYADDAPCRAVRISHVPWHYDVGALPKRRKSVDDDPHGVLGDDDHV